MKPHRPRLAPWRAACLVALLLLAQMVGLAHGIEHAGGLHGGNVSTAAADDDHADGHDGHPGHDAGSAECRLVDAHALGDLAMAGVVILPAPVAAPLPAVAPGWRPPALAPGWRSPARGPPR